MTVTIETIAVVPAPASHARPYEPRAPLVNQVDAEGLDDGIASLLSDGVERAVSRFRVGTELNRAEIVLISSPSHPSRQTSSLRLSSFSKPPCSPQACSRRRLAPGRRSRTCVSQAREEVLGSVSHHPHGAADTQQRAPSSSSTSSSTRPSSLRTYCRGHARQHYRGSGPTCLPTTRAERHGRCSSASRTSRVLGSWRGGDCSSTIGSTPPS